MKNTPARSGIMSMISLRAKIIALLIVFVFGALALVMSFGAGFATSMVMNEAGAKDRCESVSGTWDQENELCVQTLIKEVEAFNPVGGGDAYTCGNGTTFVVDTSVDGFRRLQMGGSTSTRDLVAEGSLATIFSDEEVRVSFDGLDALYEDRLTGARATCTMETPIISAE